MTDSKDKPMFTPGPWHRVDTRDYAKIMADGVATPVALVARGEDAALISAALDMYEAIEAALGIIQWMSGSADFGPGGQAHEGWKKAQSDIEKIGAALAKARGQ